MATIGLADSGTDERNGSWKEFLTLFAVALLVSSNLCLFGTSEIYFHNRVEFDSTYREILPLLLGLGGGLVALLVIIGLLIPHRFRSVYSVSLLASGPCCGFRAAFSNGTTESWMGGESIGTGSRGRAGSTP